MEHLKSPAGTKLPHLESNATSGPGLAKCIGHTLSSDRKSGSNRSCSASAKGDRVCAFENGGIEDDANGSDDNISFTSSRSNLSSCPPSSAARVNLGKHSFGTCQ